METIKITPLDLQFQKPARTSRSILKHRKVYIIEAWNHKNPNKTGWGEIAPLDGLSPEGEAFHQEMDRLAHQEKPVDSLDRLTAFPSVRFGLEAATLDLKSGGKRTWFLGSFTHGKSTIPINGLIWMGNKSDMLQQIRKKLTNGYPCLKLKIGGIDFLEEIALLKFIRKEFSPGTLELRLDANGSFHPEEAQERLKQLSDFTIHSIEQPIQPGQYAQMAKLCDANIIPIALDEELIGLKSQDEKEKLLKTIKPQFLIFKPSLIGGIAETNEYIAWCKKLNISWWVTSALESNVGLNILAQYCDSLNVEQVQGLGTGKLFTNNIKSPLHEEKGLVFADPSESWGNIESKVQSH